LTAVRGAPRALEFDKILSRNMMYGYISPSMLLFVRVLQVLRVLRFSA
jgi:hypothetical protein